MSDARAPLADPWHPTQIPRQFRFAEPGLSVAPRNTCAPVTKSEGAATVRRVTGDERPSAQFNYSLGRFTRQEVGQTSLVETRPLDAAEFSVLQDAAHMVKDLGSQTPFRVFSRSWFTLRETISAMNRIRSRTRRPRDIAPGPDELTERAMSALANFLNAGRMYLDATQHQYGKDERKDAFKKMTSEVYDDCAEYRFAYHLRNAYLHTSGIPIQLSLSSTREGIFTTAVTINRDELLNCGYDWKAVVREDLMAGPDVIDLHDVLAKSFDAYVRIEHKRVSLACRHARGALELIIGALPVEGPGGDMDVIWGTSRTNEKNLALLGPIGLPSRTWIDGLIQAMRVSAELQFLKPPDSPSIQDGLDPLESPVYTPALDIMDAWHVGGPSAAGSVMGEVLNAGPRVAHYALVGLTNMVGISMLQIEMTMGISLAESLAQFRRKLVPADDPWNSAS